MRLREREKRDRFNKIKIVDVIHHRNKYETQEMIIISRSPNFKYQRNGNWLIAEDSGFYNFYFYEKPDRCVQAFSGREFDIQMLDGSIIKAKGQWWDGIQDEFKYLKSAGCNTIEKLGKCNVFMSMCIDPAIVEKWLGKNKHSNNYSKYDKKSKSYLIQNIVSPWRR